MPRPKNPVPSYRLHKQSGQAVVTVPHNGGRKDILLGKYGSPESKAEYERILTTLRTPGGTAALFTPADPGRPDMTVAEILVAFWEHAERHYRHADGTPTSELRLYKMSLKPVREFYDHTPAREFGPRALKTCRQWMVDAKWCRKQINIHTGRIKRVFKWAASEELIPVAVYQALATVAGLQAGRSEATDHEPVQPVSDAHVDAVLPVLSRHVRGMAQFQRLTGCRPGEVCLLRRADIDTSGPVWLYRPERHKLTYRGKARTVAIGPKAQALLAEFPTADPTEYVFSPRKAMAEFRAAQRERRKSKVQPSQQDRAKAAPTKQPGERYTPLGYAHAVAAACKKAKSPHWHPNQLRHSFATRVRKDHGLEAAQVTLGHSRADVTQVYAERNEGLAAEVALKVG